MIYNPFSVEAHKDPYPMYKEMIENDPVQYNEELGFWAITRFEDVWNASRDYETFSSNTSPVLNMPLPMPILLSIDPPDHNRFRKLVSGAFTPGAINKLKERIEENVDGYIEQLKKKQSFDVISEFSSLFPMDAISNMLGIPVEDRLDLLQWSHDQMNRKPYEMEMSEKGKKGAEKAVNYFLAMMADRRENPQDDMISHLVHAKTKTEGDDEERGLDELELLGFVLMLVSAGYETVMRFFGSSIYSLYKNPKVREELINDPSLIPQAVEELLRYENPGQYMARITTKDVELSGVKIPKGEKLLLIQGAACRDPREYEKPDEINIHRKIERQIGFGNGPHLCIGAALARMECVIAFEKFLKAFPDYRVDEENIKHSYCGAVRGFECLPIHI